MWSLTTGTINYVSAHFKGKELNSSLTKVAVYSSDNYKISVTPVIIIK